MGSRIVLGGAVLAGAGAPLREDWGLAIRDGVVAELGPHETLLAGAVGATITDARHLLLSPGFVNAHQHAYGVLAHGMPLGGEPPAGFERFLSQFWWPRVEDRLDPPMIAAAMALACVKMIRCGVTTFCDVLEAPLCEEGILDGEAEVVERSGLRAVLCLEASERHGDAAGRRALAENERFARACGRGDLVRGMQCLHTSFTCSEAFVRAVKASADRLGSSLHLHLSESEYEPRECLRRYGLRPVFWYDRLGVWDENVLASQGVALSEDEIQRLARRRVRMAHMPLSNCEVGGGIAPVPGMIEAGLRPGLGTDGYIDDSFDVMRAAFLLHKGALRDAAVMSARTVVEMATEWGAAAVGRPEVGTLAPGRAADVIGIRLDADTPITRENVLDQLVLFRSRGDVELSIIAGRDVLRDGVVQTMEEEEVRAAAYRQARRLWEGTRCG